MSEGVQIPEHHSHIVEGIEQSEKKRKLIVRIVVVLLILIFLSGMVYGAVGILNEEKEPEPPFSAVPESDAGAVEYYSQMLSMLGDGMRTKLSVDTWLEIPEESVSAEDNPALTSAILYVRTQMLDKLKSFYGEYSTSYGEEYSEKILPGDFTVNDLSAIEYKENDDGNKTLLGFTFKDEDYPCPADSVIAKCFDMSEAEAFRLYAAKELSPLLCVSDCKIQCKGFTLKSEADELTDRLSNVTYIRSYSVTAVVDFTGEWSELGRQNVSFVFEVHSSYNYSWAGITLSPGTLTLEKGDTAEISAYKSADDEVDVTWSSSNPDIVSVDGEGYIKAHAVSETPVIITGSFTYLGIEYTDTCEVYVTVPVERLAISEKALSLAVGETHTLSAVVKPDNATLKSVVWVSTDDAVATVDENGVVTAISSGNAEVYAYSVDGRYKKTCEVTVR